LQAEIDLSAAMLEQAWKVGRPKPVFSGQGSHKGEKLSSHKDHVAAPQEHLLTGALPVADVSTLL